VCFGIALVDGDSAARTALRDWLCFCLIELLDDVDEHPTPLQ
jgi:hypothetical protein